MADLILNLASLKAKADAAGQSTTATSTYPSLCPNRGAITGYVTNGSSVVTISGSYTNALLVRDSDVSLGTSLTNPITVTGNTLSYNGSSQNLVTISNKPSGCTVHFKVGDNGSWTTTIPSSTTPGTWSKIYWYADAVGSYNAKNSLSSPGLVSASMSKGDRTLVWIVTKGADREHALEYGEGGAILASPSKGTGDGTITYSSSKTSIAYTSGSNVYAGSGSATTGSTCTITATISAGTYWKSASCSYTIYCYNRANGYEVVDLGLPSGTLWATRNVGASNPWNYGNYYKYGNTSPYSSSQTNYEGTENPLTLSKDAARKNWGGLWHIPTEQLLTELRTYTTWDWIKLGSNGIGDSNGVYGRRFTSLRDSSKWIFLPAAGYYSTTGDAPYSLGAYDGQGRYWSSTPSATAGKYGSMYFSLGVTSYNDDTSAAGYSVRGVIG